MTDYLVLAWRNRLTNVAPDMCLSLIEDLLCQPERAIKTAERLRHELASPSKAVRLRTLKLLERVGSLDDVTLLMDLASLPKMRDEARGERKAILETAATLARGG